MTVGVGVFCTSEVKTLKGKIFTLGNVQTKRCFGKCAVFCSLEQVRQQQNDTGAIWRKSNSTKLFDQILYLNIVGLTIEC